MNQRSSGLSMQTRLMRRVNTRFVSCQHHDAQLACVCWPLPLCHIHTSRRGQLSGTYYDYLERIPSYFDERLLKNGRSSRPRVVGRPGGSWLYRVARRPSSKQSIKSITHLPLASRRCRSLAANSASSAAAADARRSRSLRVGRSSAVAARSKSGPTRCGA